MWVTKLARGLGCLQLIRGGKQRAWSYALAVQAGWARQGPHGGRARWAASAAAATGLALCLQKPWPQAEPAQSAAGRVVDCATGLEFDDRICISPHSGCPVLFDFKLVGSGCRYKFGYVKVYALGLYLPTTSLSDFANGERGRNFCEE